MTCVTSKDSDQPVHLSSIARVLVYPSLDSTEAVVLTNEKVHNKTCQQCEETETETKTSLSSV